MIISIYALKSDMIRVVQQSLLGSILSNMLLVLGCAFFTGGIVHCQKLQVFNKAAAVVNSGLLLMAVMGILFPAVLHFTHSEVHLGKSVLSLSRFSSCIMLLAYASYPFFQLRSQQNFYTPVDQEVDTSENTDEEEEFELTKWEAIIWLAILTVWVSVLSGHFVDAIEGASESLNMSVAFISVILLPIVGNAAEHASAIMFAVEDKLDITIGVAVGSSTQISMFVIPFCVVVGWCKGKDRTRKSNLKKIIDYNVPQQYNHNFCPKRHLRKFNISQAQNFLSSITNGAKSAVGSSTVRPPFPLVVPNDGNQSQLWKQDHQIADQSNHPPQQFRNMYNNHNTHFQPYPPASAPGHTSQVFSGSSHTRDNTLSQQQQGVVSSRHMSNFVTPSQSGQVPASPHFSHQHQAEVPPNSQKGFGVVPGSDASVLYNSQAFQQPNSKPQSFQEPNNSIALSSQASSTNPQHQPAMLNRPQSKSSNNHVGCVFPCFFISK
ncbi:hypothetical protein KIW84_032130 [Lathyrus oleraceus]|uniref:Sodium/calcium exchanger membrane region domain-containing protein n=1 Tax=Pisum sativum TaxID=3888 RepID=A0A9D4XTI4_PEA|nr:hypothetical protein KIW84_032130 [Pisum sativum]